ncbi:MAG TPA: ferrochelatase [Solirubrobacteraceae bacterium]|nr:ferrochelatase [Solirubrobacteraceae bacterium]
MSETAVLAMAYGTPAEPEQLEAYYTHIRRGRPPTPELLAELRRRYEAIGGHSPLLELTRAQVAGIERALAEAGRPDIRVALGMKHAAPFIEDAVAELAGGGVRRIVGLVLAPHYSRMSVGEYTERAQAAAAGRAAVSVVPSWHLAPGYLDFLSTALEDELRALPAEADERAHVLFTAHSLPKRILDEDDPYPAQLRETAAAVAACTGLERWSVAWQSAGRTPEPWIGPDVLEAMSELAASGATAVVVCPAGFVADHLEVLYDLDIEAASRARELGIAFARTASPNTDPRLLDALAGVVLDRLAREAVTA